jgi:alpha-galactosidase
MTDVAVSAGEWAVAVKRTSVVVGAAALVFGTWVLGFGPRADAVDNGSARTPPMGWNGFNHYSRDVTASIVKAQARALVSSGMQAAGYDYVNLDGGWNLPERDPQGQLQADPSKFPDGIKPLATYVHSLGLKFGIYTSAGTTNCARTAAGSLGHYRRDAATFASWGVDFVKVDWCNVPMDQFPGMTAKQVAQNLYGRFAHAIRSADRPMLYSLSTNKPYLAAWRWAPRIGNMWRTTRDLHDSYDSMLTNFASNAPHYRAAGPGGWNDPDMLQVGNGGMTGREYRTEFSLWAEMAAPLIAGNDLTRMSAATHATLTNRAVIAVDQDRLGRQGHAVANAHGHWVLTKPLTNGARAVVLFNQTDRRAVLTTTARRVGLRFAPAYRVNNLWRHATRKTAGTIRATVAPHAVAMYRVNPAQEIAAAP